MFCLCEVVDVLDFFGEFAVGHVFVAVEVVCVAGVVVPSAVVAVFWVVGESACSCWVGWGRVFEEAAFGVAVGFRVFCHRVSCGSGFCFVVCFCLMVGWLVMAWLRGILMVRVPLMVMWGSLLAYIQW